MLRNYRFLKFFRKILLFLSVPLLFLLGSCNSYTDCPDDYFLRLQFSRKDPGNGYNTYLNVNGTRIDTMDFSAYGVGGQKKLPLNDLGVLPVDVSVKQMMFFYKYKSRTDTLILKYDLARRPCNGSADKYNGMYLQIINPVFLKNTFNESNNLINCNIIGQSVY